MNAQRLLAWGELEDRRRRQRRRGLARLPLWLWGAALGLAGGVEIARRLGLFGAELAGGATLAGASKLYLVAVVGAYTMVIFGSPFRLFWRHDAAVLARLAIPGRSLFQVGLVRSVRAAARVLVAALIAAGGFAIAGDPTAAGADAIAGSITSIDLAVRHLAVACAGALIAGFLAPAMTLLAGAMVASDKLQATLDNLGGELRAPPSSWLGVLPGVTGTSLALLAMATAGWARGNATTTIVGDPHTLLFIATAVSALAAVIALRRADAVMAPALREVVALDRERLAHVDLVKPTAIDRLVMRTLLAGADRAAVVFHKDARLSRRRFPIPYFFGFAGLATLLILAATQPDDLIAWAVAVSAFIGTYGVVMARRLLTPPTEHLRFLSTLPAGHRGGTRAKRTRALLWIGCYLVPGAAAVIARAPAPASAAIALGVTAGAALVATLVVLRTGAPDE